MLAHVAFEHTSCSDTISRHAINNFGLLKRLNMDHVRLIFFGKNMCENNKNSLNSEKKTQKIISDFFTKKLQKNPSFQTFLKPKKGWNLNKCQII